MSRPKNVHIINSNDPMRPIIGSNNISKYFGIGVRHWYHKHREKMMEYGCLAKQQDGHSAALITTPLLINIYLSLRSIEQYEIRSR